MVNNTVIEISGNSRILLAIGDRPGIVSIDNVIIDTAIKKSTTKSYARPAGVS